MLGDGSLPQSHRATESRTETEETTENFDGDYLFIALFRAVMCLARDWRNSLKASGVRSAVFRSRRSMGLRVSVRKASAASASGLAVLAARARLIALERVAR